MTIKYLVISGGGPTGFLTYGAAKYLALQKFWNLDDIIAIYGTSIGAYIGIILALGYQWNWLDDYFIKRPWSKLLKITPSDFISVLSEKGLIGNDFIIQTIKPLLEAKDLDENITLKEFYNLNKIDIHIYTVDINASPQPLVVDLSHKTHPNLSLVQALIYSSAYPLIFKPSFDGEHCYIDGGVLNNYPLNYCLENSKCDKNEILAFKNIWSSKRVIVDKDSHLIDYLLLLVRKLQHMVSSEPNQANIANIVQCIAEDITDISSWEEALISAEHREKLIQRGETAGRVFMDYITNISLS